MAFVFTSPRDEVISKLKTGQDADTALRGSNYIPGAEHFTIFPKSLRSILHIPHLLDFDFIIAQDNLLLGYIISLYARLFHLKTKWLYVAIHSSILMRRNATRPARLFLLKLFWASYTRIICISSEQIEDFMRLGIPREKLVFIPFGVDANFFQPTNSSLEGELIVSVGRDAGRDYRTLFEAVKRTHHPCIVVTSLKNVPADMPVPENVSVLYNRSLVEVRDLYVRARLVVIASKDTAVPEGSDCSGQTVILDALAAGKAVIATHRSWITDYFVPDEDLVVVPPNDPEALVRAIDVLWNDQAKRKSLAVSGHAKVAVHYTTKTFAEALLKLMNSLV